MGGSAMVSALRQVHGDHGDGDSGGAKACPTAALCGLDAETRARELFTIPPVPGCGDCAGDPGEDSREGVRWAAAGTVPVRATGRARDALRAAAGRRYARQRGAVYAPGRGGGSLGG